MSDPARWFACQHPIEQGVMVDVWFSDPLRTFTMTGANWDAIWLAQGIGWDDDRKRLFESAYHITIEETELPPPLDIVVHFDPTIWGEIYDYGDETDFPGDPIDCPVFAFKGNQGGAWPILWP